MNRTEMTAEKLCNLLQKVVDAGYGDIPVRIRENTLHDDEIKFFFAGDRHIEIDGILYNHPQYEKIAKFKEDVKKAWEELMK